MWALMQRTGTIYPNSLSPPCIGAMPWCILRIDWFKHNYKASWNWEISDLKVWVSIFCKRPFFVRHFFKRHFFRDSFRFSFFSLAAPVHNILRVQDDSPNNDLAWYDSRLWPGDKKCLDYAKNAVNKFWRRRESSIWAESGWIRTFSQSGKMDFCNTLPGFSPGL